MANRSKNVVRNINAGLLNRVITMFFGFIIRMIMIRTLGTEYLGLGSLFSSILQMLNLAELGFGNAVVFSMYKPIAEGDQEKVCALLNLYKKFYHIVGIIILFTGLLLVPFLKNLISGSYPEDVDINILYLLYLANTVLGYFLFSYKVSVFIANQRDDIRCNISSVVSTCMYAAQMIALIVTKNYYLYTVLMLIGTIIINICQVWIAKRLYPEYVCKGRIDKEARIDLIKRVVGLISYQIGGVLYNNADTIIVSAFLGLTVLARYTNYYYIMAGLTSVLSVISNAMTASIGNSVAVESVGKNVRLFKVLSNFFSWIVGWCSICLACMFQPFMYLWMGEKNLLSLSNVICFSVYFYFWNFNLAVPLYKKAAGIWWEDKIRPLIGIVVNVILNIWWVQYIGINGVVLSSVVNTALISVPWSAYFLFKCYLKLDLKKYLLEQEILFAVTLLIGIGTYLVCSMIQIKSHFMLLAIDAVICLVLPNILYFIFFNFNGEWKELREFAFSSINSAIGNKMKRKGRS